MRRPVGARRLNGGMTEITIARVISLRGPKFGRSSAKPAFARDPLSDPTIDLSTIELAQDDLGWRRANDVARKPSAQRAGRVA